MVGRQDVAGRIKGEPFDTAAAVFRLPDAAEFVVDILQRAAAPVFAPDQVTHSVVGVAAPTGALRLSAPWALLLERPSES